MLVAAAACGGRDSGTASADIPSAGKCVAVDVAATPETAALLDAAASQFNGSKAARLPNDACAFVRVQKVDSPTALEALGANWPDTERLGPAPVVWVPGSTMWGELLNARLREHHRPAMAPNGTPFAPTPLVIAMPAPMARALDYPRRPIGWAELEQLARDRRGWGAYGHPEWGPFRLGKGNPNWSTTGLDQTVATDTAPVRAASSADLEQSVVYYGASTQAYFDNWKRLSATRPASALTYLSAAITDERSVVAYNTGHEQDDVDLTSHPPRPKTQLVAIYPNNATIEGDNPMIVLDAAWSSAKARQGARLFTRFAVQAAPQAKVAAAGFRTARGTVRADLVGATNGADGTARTRAVAPASPLEIERALANWETNRKRARVLVLFDVSDSMGDLADLAHPPDPNAPSKLELAQAALTSGIDQLAPDDDIGLRIFTTKLPDSAHPNWQDLVPIGPVAARRAALHRAIAGLQRKQGSPLYSATRAAFETVTRNADPQRINAVVVLTDGYNEDDHDNDQAALLAHLTATPNIRVFTIAYSTQADIETLEKLAQATNAWNYDASATKDLGDLLARALAGL
jgi:Ca-activated chloride channel family protein